VVPALRRYRRARATLGRRYPLRVLEPALPALLLLRAGRRAAHGSRLSGVAAACEL